jgi:hypothetical protein
MKIGHSPLPPKKKSKNFGKNFTKLFLYIFSEPFLTILLTWGAPNFALRVQKL